MYGTELKVSLAVAFYSFYGKDAEQSWPSKPSWKRQTHAAAATYPTSRRG